jgi:hypothetical protein
MSIVGNIECNGPNQRRVARLRSPNRPWRDFEGSVIAQDITTTLGSVRGTIRAIRVKLQNGCSVEGDIFHRSLSKLFTRGIATPVCGH